MTEDVFIYKDFVLSEDSQSVDFNYTLKHEGAEYNMTEKLRFPVPLLDTVQQRSGLRALHLALGVSYYKIFVSAAIKHPYEMDQAEADFWNDVWSNGLGEFLYVNKLSVERLAKFTPQSGTLIRDPQGSPAEGNKAILGIGGGKDSIVAGELLKGLGVELGGFVMATGEQLGQAQSVAQVMGIPLSVVERRLDTQLIELQQRPGAYKGHVPISLIFGLVGTSLAIATGSKYVVVANESSASIPRVTWEGRPVNHQWSKSYGFEKQLQEYVRTNIHAGITYFSAIRPLTSIAVAKIFAAYSQYFEVFTSDNYVFRIDPAKRPNGRWSLESPKSLSSFILLAPWIPDEAMLRIFGQDFLNEPSIEQLFKELTGQAGHPPLDCVGTVEELVLSLNLVAQQGRYGQNYLMQQAVTNGVINSNTDWQAHLTSLLALQDEQVFPADLESGIKNGLAEKLS